jgi:hypothetical protein
MADINYVSPAGMQPKLDWAPTGFLAGKLYSDQQKQYEDTLGLSQASSMYGLQKQRNELEDYKLNTVLRERERAANIAKADATTQTALPQALANLDQTRSSTEANEASSAGTRIDNQTRGARNKAALDEKTLENRIKQTDFLIKLATMYDPNSPTAIEDLTNILSEAKENNVPEWLMRRVATNPTAYKLQMAREREAYIQAMDVAKEHSRGTLAAASVRSAQEKEWESGISTILNSLEYDNEWKDKPLAVKKAEATKRYAEMRYRSPYMDPGTKAFTTKSGEDAAFYYRTAALARTPEERAKYLKQAQEAEARAGTTPTKGNKTPALPAGWTQEMLQTLSPEEQAVVLQGSK